MRNIRRIPISLEDGCNCLEMFKLLDECLDIDGIIRKSGKMISIDIAGYHFGVKVHNDHLYIEYVMSDEGEELDVDKFLSNIDMDALSDCIYDLFQCYMIYLMRKCLVLEQKEFIRKRFPATDVKYISFDMQIKELLKKGDKA